MKQTVTFILLLFACFTQAQVSNYRTKTVAVRDSIAVDTVSINPGFFFLKTKDLSIIDSTYYRVDYTKGIVSLKKPLDTDSVVVSYLRYPDFLTKTYKLLDEDIILDNSANQQKLYSFEQAGKRKGFTPFEGLATSGSISRGVTIGNNQNSVLNSALDLQITGKLSEKVSLRASIQDANIPLQQSGYSQRLDEFDQVFIELFSDRWKIRAGDIDLQNTTSYFARFSKRVQGLSVGAKLGSTEHSTNLFLSGALVRGQFTRSQFTAQEGNQGPYKLQGPNGELYVLIVSGSETVYVNGIPLERGENKDYIIDYNAGEIIFNPTFPITSEMRITVDYQYSERNYSRFVVYGGGDYNSNKLRINASVYSETDSKNQPLQQNLSSEQVEILSEAGDDRSLMIAPSAVSESYSENKILYKKEIIDGAEVFVFSNNPEDELFSVKFTLVGNNQGNYIISNTSAISNIYEYVAPVNGIPQGNYEPIIQLIAPSKLQMAVINGTYRPSSSTDIIFELTGSKNDLNLFSSLDDNDNNGFAGKLNLKQYLIRNDSLWNLRGFFNIDYINQDFKTIEQLYNVEFGRDWSLETPMGDQRYVITGVNLFHNKKGAATYQLEHLNYSENYNGNRHVITANLKLDNYSIRSNSSIMNSKSDISNSKFIRTYNEVTRRFNKAWAGIRFDSEKNEQKTIETDSLTPISQKFSAYELFTGIGDSTDVFAEVGYKYRVNDSLRNNSVERVNTSNTYYINSRLIKSQNTDLSLYANYRTLKSKTDSIANENSLNTRLQYSQRLFKQLVLLNAAYETNSGTLPQQDFTYVEVEPGQGAYTWIDYNENGIQELEEFETAQFQDQGNYIRVLLPNQVFIRTNQNRFSTSFTLNPIQWATLDKGFKKTVSHFYYQASFLIDNKVRRQGNEFNINPFEASGENNLGIQQNFRNTIFFNRGKQHYTSSYTYLSNLNKNLLSVGLLESKLKTHQVQFTHKFATSWLIDLQSSISTNENTSENFSSKNYNIEENRFNPKLSYILNDNAQFNIYYQLTNKDNTIGNGETLNQKQYGASFTYNKLEKASINGAFNFFTNDFEGNANSPVAYQMLEGLQPGKNYTWNILVQKKITTFLDLNLNYNGRKTETSKTIHTGTIQLKAYF
ncbi:hypothetical protein [Mangrovimonas aestuarii]|uniref:hypothetical protein n=1 Tax=Mangrovimonas aestuarii TaxID=3018443 RepID=UPI0023788D14|nr:hypothetical protein [Mangrovimonas aestuarii]